LSEISINELVIRPMTPSPVYFALHGMVASFSGNDTAMSSGLGSAPFDPNHFLK
jgi:hypothetical protein